jgi:hypothetical protein
VAVFVDESAEDVGSFDAPKRRHLRQRLSRRRGWLKVEAAMRPVL